jgi:hypothetical protein
MFLVVAVGEPSLGRYASGQFDFTPLVVAATMLLLLRIVVGVRMRWQLILPVVLAAPLVMALAGRISYPLTMALLLATGASASFVTRRGRHPLPPPF